MDGHPTAGRHGVTRDSHETAWPWGSGAVRLLLQPCSLIVAAQELDMTSLQSSSAAIKGEWYLQLQTNTMLSGVCRECTCIESEGQQLSQGSAPGFSSLSSSSTGPCQVQLVGPHQGASEDMSSVLCREQACMDPSCLGHNMQADSSLTVMQGH